MYFPSVVRSGQIPSRACRPPGPVREVITSSKINRMPASRVAARSATRNSGVAGMQPPDPIMGSRMTAAMFSSPMCLCISSRAYASASLAARSGPLGQRYG